MRALPVLHATGIVAILAASHLGGAVPAGRTPLSALLGLASLAAEFTPWLFLPLPVWALTTAASRTRAALLAVALPWLVFLVVHGHLLPPYARAVGWTPDALSSATVPADPPVPLRVMTFNVGASLRDPRGLLDAVERAAPDVLLIQELTHDMAAVLAPSLAAAYPHSSLRTEEAIEQGIWSRLPLVAHDAWDCPAGTVREARAQHVALVLPLAAPTGSVDASPTGSASQSTTTARPRRVDVVNAHPHPPAVRWHSRPGVPFPVILGQVTEGRWREVDGLARCAERLLAPVGASVSAPVGGPADPRTPLILAGDLNLTEHTPEYRRLTSVGLRDAHREAGLGFGLTFPARPIARVFGVPFPPVPLVRLDYVLYSPGVRVRGVRVWPATGTSDHQPVVADLLL